jgi:hypothetical protein
MTAELKRLRPVRSQRDAVADWLDQRVHWLKAYEDLLRKLPDASKLYLTAISFSETGSSSRPGAIHLEGYADSRSTVASIAMRLAEDGRYRLQPIALHAASRDPNYPQAFEADLTLLRAEETEIDVPSPAIRDSAIVSDVAPDVRTGAPDFVHRIVRRK